MTNSRTRIPVFPLGVVLFPESRIPLHIFEDRYKKLINDAINDKSSFGINYVEGDRLHAVGCSARVVEVLERHPDGEIDVVTEGESRYEVLEFEQNGPGEISFATVRWLDDEPEERDMELPAKPSIFLMNLPRSRTKALSIHSTKSCGMPKIDSHRSRSHRNQGWKLRSVRRCLALRAKTSDWKCCINSLLNYFPKFRNLRRCTRLSATMAIS